MRSARGSYKLSYIIPSVLAVHRIALGCRAATCRRQHGSAARPAPFYGRRPRLHDAFRTSRRHSAHRDTHRSTSQDSRGPEKTLSEVRVRGAQAGPPQKVVTPSSAPTMQPRDAATSDRVHGTGSPLPYPATMPSKAALKKAAVAKKSKGKYEAAPSESESESDSDSDASSVDLEKGGSSGGNCLTRRAKKAESNNAVIQKVSNGPVSVKTAACVGESVVARPRDHRPPHLTPRPRSRNFGPPHEPQVDVLRHPEDQACGLGHQRVVCTHVR